MKKQLLLTLLFFSLVSLKSQPLMTVREVYDYAIGDVFILRIGGYSTAGAFGKTTITNKYYSSQLDTVFYVADRVNCNYATCPSCTTSCSSSTGNVFYYTNLNDIIGDSLGTKPNLNNLSCIDTTGYTGIWLDTNFYDPNFCNRQITKISRMDNGGLTGPCYGYFEPFWGYDEYGRGIGQVSHYYNTCANGFPNCEQGMRLVYYNKGTDSCGTIPFLLSDYEMTKANKINVYPNPFSDKTTIRFDEEQTKTTITLTDVQGRLVKSQLFTGKELLIEKEMLCEGIYFVRINNGKKVYYSKLIIQ